MIAAESCSPYLDNALSSSIITVINHTHEVTIKKVLKLLASCTWKMQIQLVISSQQMKMD